MKSRLYAYRISRIGDGFAYGGLIRRTLLPLRVRRSSTPTNEARREVGGNRELPNQVARY